MFPCLHLRVFVTIALTTRHHIVQNERLVPLGPAWFVWPPLRAMQLFVCLVVLALGLTAVDAVNAPALTWTVSNFGILSADRLRRALTCPALFRLSPRALVCLCAVDQGQLTGVPIIQLRDLSHALGHLDAGLCSRRDHG